MAGVNDTNDLTEYELDTLWSKTTPATVELTRALSADVRQLITEVRRRREMGSREESLAQRLGERNADLAERQRTLDAAYTLLELRVKERDEARARVDDAREVLTTQARHAANQEREILELREQLVRPPGSLRRAG